MKLLNSLKCPLNSLLLKKLMKLQFLLIWIIDIDDDDDDGGGESDSLKIIIHHKLGWKTLSTCWMMEYFNPFSKANYIYIFFFLKST